MLIPFVLLLFRFSGGDDDDDGILLNELVFYFSSYTIPKLLTKPYNITSLVPPLPPPWFNQPNWC